MGNTESSLEGLRVTGAFVGLAEGAPFVGLAVGSEIGLKVAPTVVGEDVGAFGPLILIKCLGETFGFELKVEAELNRTAKRRNETKVIRKRRVLRMLKT